MNLPPPIQPETATPTKKGPPIVLILVLILGICGFGAVILAAILFPVLAAARNAAIQTTAMSNVKQVGLAVLLYADDNDSRFPLKMASSDDLSGSLAKYLSPDASLHPHHQDGESNVVGNPKLSGIDISLMETPELVPMVYDSQTWEGRWLVSFADGHTKTEKFDLQATLAQPLQLSKPTKP